MAHAVRERQIGTRQHRPATTSTGDYSSGECPLWPVLAQKGRDRTERSSGLENLRHPKFLKHWHVSIGDDSAHDNPNVIGTLLPKQRKDTWNDHGMSTR